MIQGEALCFSNGDGAGGMHHGHPSNLYNDVVETSFNAGTEGIHHTQSVRSILFSLSILKEKIHKVDSFVSIFLTQENQYHAHSTINQLTSSMAFSSMANLIQEIVQTASLMMLNCERMALGPTHVQTGNTNNNINNSTSHVHVDQEQHTMQKANNNGLVQFSVDEVIVNSTSQGFLDGINFNNHQAINRKTYQELDVSTEAYDLVEVDAADLLAKYTHYCQVCGRGFKREANLRMHMRAHGDKYKSSLMSDPLKKKNNEENNTTKKPPRKYSCPQKGCRWNKNHVKFQPLKSMVCVRNHYKRSHCPKMFVCNRCNTKEFSVLSDFKTHEKHCGDVKWYCSCGTSFSKKDKLMNHVALFVGHTPLIYPLVMLSDSR
ncbi:protein SENSITIVE TO PROTON RHIZOTOXICITY 2-like [Chenopodium quinoa]|uniref:C2H2-type domain-containing protein n=1 Tax=Chenopodium quinoa TaxID=63459 RepID=A0A803MGP4_CHEQI|nr:protein SENSITIVE TO PROTON RHIZOTOXICITY 2-like [Chenopodium quinoa]